MKMPKQLPLTDVDWRKIMETAKTFGPDMEKFAAECRKGQGLIGELKRLNAQQKETGNS
jgi:hypothetical protein